MPKAQASFAALLTSHVTRLIIDWALRILLLSILGLHASKEQRNSIWYLITTIYVAPFVVLAPLNGSISNSLPKRWVLVGSAFFCLATLAAFAWINQYWLWGLGLVAIGSALHHPTRYAMLNAAAQDMGKPLSRVLGWFEIGGAAAVVLGVILGFKITLWLTPELHLLTVVLLVLSVLCFLSSISTHFASDIRRPEPPLEALGGFFRDWKRIMADPACRSSLLGLSFFMALATAQAGPIFIHTLDNHNSLGNDALYGLLMVCLGGGLGAAVASLQPHVRRGLGLVPIGLILLVGAQLWFGYDFAKYNAIVLAPCFFLGFMGGLIPIPLRTAYQAAVPADARGNAMAVMNITNSVIMTSVAAGMWVLTRTGVLSTPLAQVWFLAGLTAISAIYSVRVLFAPLLEQLVEWVLWPRYRIQAHGPGVHHIPERGPLLLVANHASYMDPFWIAKIVPRKVTPMMTSRFYDRPIIHWLMVHVVQAIRVNETSFRREAPELQQAIEVLRQGGCVMIFPEGFLRRREDRLLRQFGRGVWHILREVPQTQVVTFWIEGGWGSYYSYKDGLPAQNKKKDWWRAIDIGVNLPATLDPAILAEHRTTRRYLMRACLEARRHLGLEVPSEDYQISIGSEDKDADDIPSGEPQARSVSEG